MVIPRIKKILKDNFTSLAYFYEHLGYRITVILCLSLFVGILDGLGLSMFIPLLETISSESSDRSSSMGNFSFLVDALKAMGFVLDIKTVLLVILFFFTFKGIVKFFEQNLSVSYRQYFIRNLRIDSIKSLTNISYNSFVKSDIGRIQNTVTGETGKVVNGFNIYMTIIQQFVLMIVYSLMALFANPKFAMLVAFGAIITNLIFKNFYKVTKKLSIDQTNLNHKLHGLIIQLVNHFTYLKATGNATYYADKVIDEVINLENNQKKMGFIGALSTALREPVTILLVVLSIYIQVIFMGGNLSSIILSILFFYRALSSVMQIQSSWNRYLEISGSFKNLDSFIKELKGKKEIKGEYNFNSFNKKLVLNDVSFSYDKNKILKNINLKIEKNETVAFVGESGSGKTTLMNIINGLLIPDTGNYFIDSFNIREINVETFQNKIGYITQEPVIFNETIFDNITFWQTNNYDNKKKFKKVLKQANILDFVESLPDKENTILGHNGINLSGGQKQRLSIARELFKGAQIILLDEATSALDSGVEKKIQQSFDDLKGNFTLIIIAHRLSTVKNADKIVVLSDGQILDIGDFYTLKEGSEVFSKMVNNQNL